MNFQIRMNMNKKHIKSIFEFLIIFANNELYEF